MLKCDAKNNYLKLFKFDNNLFGSKRNTKVIQNLSYTFFYQFNFSKRGLKIFYVLGIISLEYPDHGTYTKISQISILSFSTSSFRAMGTTVVGTAGTKEGMDVVSRCGAHHVFNHNHKSYEKKMVEHLGTGFDVIIEHLANINLGHDLQMLKPSARVMVVGCRGAVNINPRHLMLPEASIRSFFTFL